MKTTQRFLLGAILLLGIFVLVTMYPSNAKADPVGITITPTDTPTITDTPPTEPPPPPVITISPTPTVTETQPTLPPPPQETTPPPPPKPKPSKTPEPLLPETGQNPIDPFQGSGLIGLGVIALLGLSGGLVLGISLTARKKEVSKDS